MRNVGGWGDRGQGSGRGGNNNSSVYAGRLIHGDEGDCEIDRGGVDLASRGVVPWDQEEDIKFPCQVIMALH